MRRRRATIRLKLWVVIFAAFWGITPLMFCLADMERGYDATGGEVFIPLMPVIALAMNIAGRKSRQED